MTEFIKRLNNLLTVKSLLTLALTAGFLYLTFIGMIGAEVFMSVYSLVIGFYFSTQATKKEK